MKVIEPLISPYGDDQNIKDSRTGSDSSKLQPLSSVSQIYPSPPTLSKEELIESDGSDILQALIEDRNIQFRYVLISIAVSTFGLPIIAWILFWFDSIGNGNTGSYSALGVIVWAGLIFALITLYFSITGLKKHLDVIRFRNLQQTGDINVAPQGGETNNVKGEKSLTTVGIKNEKYFILALMSVACIYVLELILGWIVAGAVLGGIGYGHPLTYVFHGLKFLRYMSYIACAFFGFKMLTQKTNNK